MHAYTAGLAMPAESGAAHYKALGLSPISSPICLAAAVATSQPPSSQQRTLVGLSTTGAAVPHLTTLPRGGAHPALPPYLPCLLLAPPSPDPRRLVARDRPPAGAQRRRQTSGRPALTADYTKRNRTLDRVGIGCLDLRNTDQAILV
ncbi:hypothetical protein GUJ93_ZPchr0003g16512 [Zizania palustris]|uniref:Uncharacterized protein n=1 Tax=Zizania palustris TaxID=103762 RepID=A0A8J5S395_ZIZPA|nr:hypothetical protein GUJ93_ZPchr0003g16512 [Zizania palustris]